MGAAYNNAPFFASHDLLNTGREAFVDAKVAGFGKSIWIAYRGLELGAL